MKTKGELRLLTSPLQSVFETENSTVSPIDDVIDQKETTDELPLYMLPDENNACRKHDSFFFLKTSKTGSTTISNMFFKFGYKYDKTFLFGEQTNGAIFWENGYVR